MTDQQALHRMALSSVEELAEHVGVGGPPRPSKFPVNEAMIGMWCDAVGDENPAYQSAAWASSSRWNGIIAPATSLNMWTLPGYRRIHPPGEPLDVVTQTLNRAGFTSVAAVQNDHSYNRPLRPGDRLFQVQHLGWLSEHKRTALGEGYFFDIVSDFVTESGENVGRATMRIFKWMPNSGSGGGNRLPIPASSAPETVAGKNESSVQPAHPASNLTPGAILPPWSLDLTATRIIALAAATLDFNDVHFDRDAAVAAGAKAIYMNILGSSGLMNRYLTDWAGPQAELKSIRVALRNQNHPGDTLGFSGVVRSVLPAEQTGRLAVELDVLAANQRGTHQEATVCLEVDA